MIFIIFIVIIIGNIRVISTISCSIVIRRVISSIVWVVVYQLKVEIVAVVIVVVVIYGNSTL